VTAMFIPVIGAWLVTAFASWSTARFESVRQVRLAVIGSEEIALGLDEELRTAGIKRIPGDRMALGRRHFGGPARGRSPPPWLAR